MGEQPTFKDRLPNRVSAGRFWEDAMISMSENVMQPYTQLLANPVLKAAYHRFNEDYYKESPQAETGDSSIWAYVNPLPWLRDRSSKWFGNSTSKPAPPTSTGEVGVPEKRVETTPWQVLPKSYFWKVKGHVGVKVRSEPKMDARILHLSWPNAGDKHVLQPGTIFEGTRVCDNFVKMDND